MVSTWLFHPMNGNGRYGSFRLANRDKRERCAPMISSDEPEATWLSPPEASVEQDEEDVAAVITMNGNCEREVDERGDRKGEERASGESGEAIVSIILRPPATLIGNCQTMAEFFSRTFL